MNKRILWKALDGREFIIDTNELGLKDMEAVYAHIAELRKKHNTGDPTFMSAVGNVPEEGTIKQDSLPQHLQEAVNKAFKEALSKPDPKKLD